MGFFDFLKDVGFKAPEPEPQRGTLIQTDNIGTDSRPVNRIVTTPTDDGRSRIMSRDEYSRRNTSQGRSRDEGNLFKFPDFDPRQMDTRGFSATTPKYTEDTYEMRNDAGIAAMPRNIYRDMDAQRQRVSGLPAVNTSNISLPQRKPVIIPPISKPIVPYDQENEGDDPNDALQRILDQRARFSEDNLTTDESPALVNQYAEDDYEMRNDAVMYQPVDPRRFSRRPRKALNFMDQDAIDRADETPLTGDRYYQALEEYGIDPLNIASKEFINRGGVDPTNIMERFKPEFPKSQNLGARLKNPNELFQEQNVVSADLYDNRGLGEGRLGGDMVGIGKNVPAYTTQAYTGSQPKQGVSSFADAKQEIKEGKDSGIKDLNFLQKIMAVARNPIGRAMGYETDDKGMLTMKGLADMEADKQRSQAIYAEGQRQRNKDRDRAMMGQQTPIDPCPTGFTFDPSTQSCVADASQEEETSSLYGQRNPMSRQEYMNQFRRAGETGDVPLTQYGRRGGEYKYYLRDGGPPKQATGVVRGAGGPKDDLVGPVMLSNSEYVLPTEQVSMYGGGNYQTGLKRLENDRIKALNNFA